MKKTLPSGAILEIQLAPIADARELLRAVCEEGRTLNLQANFNNKAELLAVLAREIGCTAFSSRKVEAALAECLKRVLYNNERITIETFEPEKARQDFIPACVEVTIANLYPFGRSLAAWFAPLLEELEKHLSSK